MFTVAIKDFELGMNHKNLSLENSAICLELYAQKSKKDEFFVLFSLL